MTVIRPKATSAVAAQKGQQEAGEAAEEEPGAEDFSIVMRAMQEPQQEDEERELHQARVDLGGVQRHSQRGSGHRSRTGEDHSPGQVGRRSVVASSFQAADGDDGTTQRQAGSNGIGGSPDGEAEVQGIDHAGRNCDRDSSRSGTACSAQTHVRARAP